MVYESSYESGRKPFLADSNRGNWAAPSDFLYACWGLAFKMDIFSLSWYFVYKLGIWALIPYLICMMVIVVPIILMQSYLGQFSSSGFISVFRIAPLFKGIGYISLAINFIMLCHMSSFAAIPLFYLFHSMRPTIPWSCESFVEWSKVVPTDGELNTCTNQTYGSIATTTTTTTTTTITPITSEINANETDNYQYEFYHIPSVVYFRSLFSNYDMNDYGTFSLSWQLLLCMLLVWTVIAFIFIKILTTENMGKLIRSILWLSIFLLLICLLRMSFLPYAGEVFRAYFRAPEIDLLMSLSSIPLFTLVTFGTGWGNIVSLASYNKFRTNIMRLSWFVSLGQMAIIILFGMMTHVIDTHYSVITDNKFQSKTEYHWLLYLASGSVFVDLEMPNLWSILFFGFLVLSGLLNLIIQLFALLTAIFDEFESLRPHKKEVTLTLIGLLSVCSIVFCSNYGLTYFSVLPADALFTQTALNLLLLLVVLWIYGRVRFQRDIEFMLGQRFGTWRVNMLRYIAPLGLCTTLLLAVVVAHHEHYFYASLEIYIVAFLFTVIPWLFVPGYGVLGLIQTTGSLGMRFKRCCRPTDWYPADPEERQRYEDAIDNTDITHQLKEVDVDDVEHSS